MDTLLSADLRLFLNHGPQLSLANDAPVLPTQHMVVRYSLTYKQQRVILVTVNRLSGHLYYSIDIIQFSSYI